MPTLLFGIDAWGNKTRRRKRHGQGIKEIKENRKDKEINFPRAYARGLTFAAIRNHRPFGRCFDYLFFCNNWF